MLCSEAMPAITEQICKERRLGAPCILFQTVLCYFKVYLSEILSFSINASCKTAEKLILLFSAS